MAICTRFGQPVEFIRPATLEDVKVLDNRKPDKHDKERIKIGYYMVGRIVGQDESTKDKIFELAFLRADDGSKEIVRAARLAGAIIE